MISYYVQCCLYNVVHRGIHVTVYTIQCTVYSVQCTVYMVQCTVYSVQCTVYSVLTALRNQHSTQNDVVPLVDNKQTILWFIIVYNHTFSVYHTPYTVQRTLYTVQRTLYTVTHPIFDLYALHIQYPYVSIWKCDKYDVRPFGNILHCTLYIVQCTLYTVQRTLYTVQAYALSVYYVMRTVCILDQ